MDLAVVTRLAVVMRHDVLEDKLEEEHYQALVAIPPSLRP